uniref:Bm670 n=1 Tax=Brugia malayi TaxID=6279 RepID=A0A1I9G4P9_BRUMA|nr:Bm670 [Brugia malayi]
MCLPLSQVPIQFNHDKIQAYYIIHEINQMQWEFFATL